jgi:hypothetical protein
MIGRHWVAGLLPEFAEFEHEVLRKRGQEGRPDPEAGPCRCRQSRDRRRLDISRTSVRRMLTYLYS